MKNITSKMKSIVPYLGLILITTLLFYNKNVDKDNVVIEIGQSSKFSKEELDTAVNYVKESFDFDACTLNRIYYDEHKSNKGIQDYLQYGNGSKNNIKPENIIILFSDFSVDNSGNNPVLNPGQDYTDYCFILTRNDKNSNWTIDDAGY